MSEAKLLVELQGIDLEILRLRKKLQDLPQRASIKAIDEKYAEVSDKSAQISELRHKSETELKKLSDEDDSLVARGIDLEEKIAQTTDYRMITSLTRDLEGVAKRRNKIEFDSAAILERLEKTSEVEKKVASAMEKLEGQKAELVSQIVEVETEAKDTLQKSITRRAEIALELGEDAMKKYEISRKKHSGIAVGVLEGSHCSVCRVEFPGNKVREFLDGPEIIECPQCHRILVIEKD